MNDVCEEPARVMVVDDNQDAAISMGLVLSAAGYVVKTCFDGSEALAQAAWFRPDACILDITMPGMNGYELAKRLRERNANRPPVLATITGYDDFAHLDRAAEAGFDLHFTKPADPTEVANQLQDCLRR